jgi:hypothetical protein
MVRRHPVPNQHQARSRAAPTGAKTLPEQLNLQTADPVEIPVSHEMMNMLPPFSVKREKTSKKITRR